MFILTDMIKGNNSKFTVSGSFSFTKKSFLWILLFCSLFSGCSMPEEPIEFLRVKDVVVDATSDPKLKAELFFFNPNDTRMKLKKIDIDIFYDGKKVGEIDQKLKTAIPAKSEFSIPVEVNLAIKELNIVNTLLSMIGGKSMEIQYKGHLKLTYHGFPVRVPIDFKDDIRQRF